MEIPPLSERPVSQEEEKAFLRSIQPRRGLFGRRFIGPRRWRPDWAWVPRVRGGGRSSGTSQSGEGDATFDSGSQSGGAAFGGGGSGGGVAWLRADPVDWGIRIAVVLLIVAGCYAVYINGVAEGWWRAWGENPTAIPTRSAMSGRAPTPTPTPSASGEAAMPGGYQIGPDGVLVRPAEHAASTYTLPELPQAATENSERGAEAAAEHYLAVATYAWNTGDTSAVSALSGDESTFARALIKRIDDSYSNGWTFGNSITIDHVLLLEPVPANGADVPPNTIGVKFRVTAVDGTTCSGQRITVQDEEYHSTISLFMTWRDNRWIETQGRAESDDK